MHAVGGRARHEVHARLGLEHAQRHIEGEGIARAAFVAVRRDDRDLGQGGEGLAQAADALGAKAVVVTDQNLHLVNCVGCAEVPLTIL